MLPKHSRLTKETIEKYLIKARRARTPRFLVMYAIVPLQKAPQISFVASKKVAPRAVDRNKLRRRGYASAKPFVHRLSPGAAILVSYTTKDLKAPIKEMTEELEKVLLSARLLS